MQGKVNMKIISLKAENIKKLVAVEIKPDGNMVQITGKNGQGKTSVLDSIWWALSGAANIQGNPIRQGENKARIRLDLGEIVVERKFKKTEQGNTISSITVENAEGTAIKQPQTMLDKLIGELSFDPLMFARMSKKDQFEQLKRFVPDVDFEAIERAHEEDYDKRTNVNRQALEARTIEKNIFVALPAGTKAIDESALVDELEAAGQFNTAIETRRANREKVAAEAMAFQEKNNRLVKEANELQAKAEEKMAESQVAIKEAVRLQAKLADAPPLPTPKDVTPIKDRITEARKINEAVKLIEQKAKLISNAEQFEEESACITAQINERNKDKQAKIAKVKLPVAGLGFGDGEILLDGIQFAQASDAEQLRASCSMAMALNPELRVIRVRDGSLLDEDGMKMLEEMANDKDYQVWIEVVGTGKVGFVLEDGHVTEAKKLQEAI